MARDPFSGHRADRDRRAGDRAAHRPARSHRGLVGARDAARRSGRAGAAARGLAVGSRAAAWRRPAPRDRGGAGGRRRGGRRDGVRDVDRHARRGARRGDRRHHRRADDLSSAASRSRAARSVGNVGRGARRLHAGGHGPRTARRRAARAAARAAGHGSCRLGRRRLARGDPCAGAERAAGPARADPRPPRPLGDRRRARLDRTRHDPAQHLRALLLQRRAARRQRLAGNGDGRRRGAARGDRFEHRRGQALRQAGPARYRRAVGCAGDAGRAGLRASPRRAADLRLRAAVRVGLRRPSPRSGGRSRSMRSRNSTTSRATSACGARSRTCR